MLKKDFLLRQFEEFGKVMAVILGLKKNAEWEPFEMEIDKAVRTYTPFEIKELIEKDEISFEALIKSANHLKSDQIRFLADLLYERSFVSGNKANENEMIDLLKKSLFLYELFSNALTVNDYNVEVRYRMELIRKVIEDHR